MRKLKELGEAIEYYDTRYDMNSEQIYIDDQHAVSAELQLLLYTRSSIERFDRGEKIMDNYHVYLPEAVDYEAWYLIYESNQEFKDELEDAGLEKVDCYRHFELWQ